MDTGQILSEVEAFNTLEHVIRWALARTPRAEFVDVVVQDEFTHDVIVRVDAGHYLVFDTT